MKHLIKSFQEHTGLRGVHFYDEDACRFLSWSEVFEFLGSIPDPVDIKGPFADRLTETLANYDPNTEYLAVQQFGTTVSVELYANALGMRKK